MTNKQDPLISAQVLLKPASGTMPRDVDITAENIGSLAPAPEAAAEVARALAGAGFEVGPVVGLSFSISARRSVFDRFFGIESAGATKGTIPLDRVPALARRHVAAVTFPPPPDFGPTRYS
jgi:hypothetical protein